MDQLYEKTLFISSPYLYVAVRDGAPKVVARLYRGEALAREFEVELGLDGEADWWAFYDLSPFAGEELRLAVSAEAYPPTPPEAVARAFTLADGLPEMPGLYGERHRPQFHFTARRGWNNDPNGLVYHRGEWHMFYQHNPFGVHWGNMHWGHAVSPDLAHWQELPEALYQRSLDDMAFSGGGFVDYANAAGFQEGPEPPLVVAFTSTGRGECLAYSNDRGRTLSEYAGNPVIRHWGRDPKILWYEPEQKWVMVVYEEPGGPDSAERGYAFYDSTNLQRWNRRSYLSGWYECPELFPMPVEGEQGEVRWVLYGCRWERSKSACWIGQFDGQQFTALEENATAHYGPHFYAAQNFSGAPGGRQIMVGWLAGAQYPGMPFSQGMTVPLELALRRTPGGLRLCFYPVQELETLHAHSVAAAGLSFEDASDLLARVDSELLDLELALLPAGSAPLALDVRGHALTYDPAARTLAFAGVQAALPPGPERLDLRVLVDRSVTEVFANQGLAAFSAMTIFEEPSRPVEIRGNGLVEEIRVHQLRSMWG